MIISLDDRADSDHIYTAVIGRNGDVMMTTAAGLGMYINTMIYSNRNTLIMD